MFEETINMHLIEQGGKMHRNYIHQTKIEVDNRDGKNSNLKKTPKCEVCQRFGHLTEKCFQHPIKGEENLKNAKFCLLCRSYEHLSHECNLYPDSILVVEGCKDCKNKGYFACHSSDNCKGIDRDYALYADLQKKAKSTLKN